MRLLQVPEGAEGGGERGLGVFRPSRLPEAVRHEAPGHRPDAPVGTAGRNAPGSADIAA